MTRRALAALAFTAGVAAVITRAVADGLAAIKYSVETYDIEAPPTVPADWLD